MNVIVANDQQNALADLDIDVIKSITGSYDVSEIVEMFKSFFYSKMILDVTAIKNYNEIKNYEILAKGLDPEKIIFLLPEGSNLCTPNFLGNLISFGIYNFTTNLNGIKYLLKKSNTLKDVEHIKKMASVQNSSDTGASSVVTANVSTKVKDGVTIIGFKNVTEHAGATTLIYMLKKELSNVYGHDGVVAIEIDSNDFQLFGDKNMVSTKASDIKNAIQKFSNAKIILVDLNGCSDDSFCADVIHLIEPSTIRLNNLVRRNKMIFSKLVNQKVILNQSLLLNNDISDFESEAGIKILYNIPPLDDRKRNNVLNDFLSKLGLVGGSNGGGSGKIFGLFRR